MSSNTAIFWIILLCAIVWLITLFVVFRMIATRKDLSLLGKALWLLIIFLAPLLGLIAYFAIGHKSVKRKT